MEEFDSLYGKLLISQPVLKEKYFSETTILISHHSISGAWGLITNRPAANIKVKDVLRSVNLPYDKDTPAYIGGPLEQSRVFVIHSLDWSSNHTKSINDEVGLTGDIEILEAISNNTGPKYFKIGLGACMWGPGQLEGEQSGTYPWNSQNPWLYTKASERLTLKFNDKYVWREALDVSINERVKLLF